MRDDLICASRNIHRLPHDNMDRERRKAAEILAACADKPIRKIVSTETVRVKS